MRERSSPQSDAIAIIGAGHAGATAAAAIRQLGCKRPISVIGDEVHLPYNRPPLSKDWLKGSEDAQSLLLRSAAFYREQHIDVRLAKSVVAIDRGSKALILSDDTAVGYSQLVIATGARSRTIGIPGGELSGIYYLRTLDDAVEIRAALRFSKKVLIIGGGYIGLELAATAKSMGADVTVLEKESRVLSRVASEQCSAFIAKHHQRNGIKVELSTSVRSLGGAHGRLAFVELADGRILKCDTAVVGIGAIPNDELAVAAGLACQDGIIVNSLSRTSDPDIYAIGDCAVRPLPYASYRGRLESVQSALEQARQAAAAICDCPPRRSEVPWFWSNQSDLRLQIAGYTEASESFVIRPRGDFASTAIFHRDSRGCLQGVEAINMPAAFAVGRLVIAQGGSVSDIQLASMIARAQEAAPNLRSLQQKDRLSAENNFN